MSAIKQKSVRLRLNEETGEYYGVDMETGEVIVNIKSGVPVSAIRIITTAQQDFFDLHKDKFGGLVGTFKPFENYGKNNLKAEAKIAALHLSGAEYSLYLFLKSHVGAKHNIVKQSRMKYATIDWITEELGYSKSVIYTAMKRLEKEEIILTVQNRNTNCIFFNPYIFFKGKTIEKKTYFLFQSSVWAKNERQEGVTVERQETKL